MVKLNVVKVIRYETFIFVGIIMLVAALIKIFGIYDFSSDWFWFLVGMGLVIEGTISLIKQKKFERKYKIIERSEVGK